KIVPQINSLTEGLQVQVLTRSNAKFSFFAPESYVLLNADGYEYNRKGDSILKGFVTSDRTILLKKLSMNFHITKTNMNIQNIEETEKSLVLTILQTQEKQPNELCFESDKKIKSITFNEREIKIIENPYRLELGAFTGTDTLKISF
ncbi:MAG: hypothetical protein KDF60_19190, partial [Calditrichaeota bacterium]|nr:hypothetical protein [Calditrichota bacterium]